MITRVTRAQHYEDSPQMLAETISPRRTVTDHFPVNEALRPQCVLMGSDEGGTEEGRAWGWHGDGPSLARPCPSACARQLQLSGEESLSAAVSAPLYIQTPPSPAAPTI